MSRKQVGIQRVTRPAVLPADYPAILKNIKQRICAAQVRATLSANAELIRLYWDIGRAIDQRQQREGWGAGVIPRLAKDIRNDLPEVKGFSERNIGRMIAFPRAYSELGEILPQPVAKSMPASSLAPPSAILPQPAAKLPRAEKVPQPAAQLPGAEKVLQPVAQTGAICDTILLPIPWGHHVLLMEKVKNLPARLWYMQQTVAHGWSRSIPLTRALPAKLKSSLPSIEEIEAELSAKTAPRSPRKPRNRKK